MAQHVCRSCGAKIQWAITEKGRRMPIDVVPNWEHGNIALYPRKDDVPIAIVVTKTEIEAWRASGAKKRLLFTSHFVTCPQSAHWRKSKGGRNH